MKPIKLLVGIMLAIFCGLASSCSGDDDSTLSKDRWYVKDPGFLTESDFYDINSAIDNHELLESHPNYYAEVETFFPAGDDGPFSVYTYYVGRFQYSLQTGVNIIHIIDDSTIEFYSAFLYLDQGEQNKDGEMRLWHFNAGRHFGEMAYYADPSIFVYIKENNTMVLSNGDIYLDNGNVIQDSNGRTYRRFTPKF